MNAHRLGAAVLASCLCISASAQDLELKGMKPGDAMSACPEGSRPLASQTAESLCSLGPSTLANQEATDHLVAFHDGVVVAIMYRLKDQGRHANALVLEALKQKYGPPTLSKPHINDYTWQKGRVVLGLDGYKGMVTLLDRDLIEKARAAGAAKDKKDI